MDNQNVTGHCNTFWAKYFSIFRFSFVFRNFCVRRGEGRRHGGAARPARPRGPARALAATNAKIEKRGGQASERPGVRTPGRPGVRASGRPSVRPSGRPDFRTFWHPDGTSEPTFVGANIQSPGKGGLETGGSGPPSFGINHGSISFGQLSGYIVFCTLPIRGAKPLL